MTLETLCTTFTGSTEAQIRVLISELQLDKKIKALEHNLNSFTRVQADQEVTVVKQMPKVEAAKQPTIAIITSQYFEKMAVDAMMSNRQTFVRYATVGRWDGDRSCCFVSYIWFSLMFCFICRFSFDLRLFCLHSGITSLIEIFIHF